jgi:hypothetical protein
VNATVRWAGEPARCTCPPGKVAATIEETLDCPFAWLEVPGTGWVHTRWLRDPGGAR